MKIFLPQTFKNKNFLAKIQLFSALLFFAIVNCNAQNFDAFKGNGLTSFQRGGVPATPSICMVTVDANSVNNIIYWDKTSYTDADSFIVYRDAGTSYYRKIGVVPADSLSQYIDTARSIGPANGDPNLASYRYKLQVQDTLGNYSALSPYHSTIYIVDAGLGLFTWSTPYTIEGAANPVTSYVLLCDTANTNVWGPVNTVSGTDSSAVDPGFVNHSNIANWRVKTAWNISCTPTRTTVNTTRSNIKHANSSSLGINSETMKASAAIYPNPAAGSVTVEINDQLENASMKIVNVVGQIMEAQEIMPTGGRMIRQINLSSYPKGLYFLSIESSGTQIHKTFIVN